MTSRATMTTAVVALAMSATAVACGGGDADDLGGLAPAGALAEIDGSGPASGADDDGSDGDALTVEPEPEPVRPTVEIPTEWPSEIEAMYGRYWLYWDAFAAAHAPPGADPDFAPLRELSTEANWASLQDQLQSFADDGLVLELPEPSITEHLLRLPDAALLEGVEGEEIVLQDCWIDDFVQRTLDGAVVAEARKATLMNVVMKVVGGEWRVDGVTRAPPDSDGVEQCAELIN